MERRGFRLSPVNNRSGDFRHDPRALLRAKRAVRIAKTESRVDHGLNMSRLRAIRMACKYRL